MKKLLALNRGEIAIRIMRAATELGLRTVAVFPKEDSLSLHRFKADEAYQIGEGKGPVEAYLDVPGIVALAKEKGVDAIHPGYGFLSENPALPRACAEAGITFVGPSAELLEMLGDKTAARRLAARAGVPIIPGVDDALTSQDAVKAAAERIGYPLIIKAAFGGGGRGMRVVESPADLAGRFDEASREAAAAFGNGAVFIERFIARPRHIEVQILGDRHGNVLHLYERDCSVQRRHQKVVEVAPAVSLDASIRTAICDAAVRLMKTAGYDNAGTVEFLLDSDTNDWYFIEVNPRIQVEHTVTEMVTGIDLLRCLMLVAQGYDLHSAEIGLPPQDEVPLYGYALQCRVTTEDPQNNFVPDYGKIHTYRSPAGFGVRLDGGSAYGGAAISPYYDSLLVTSAARMLSGPLANLPAAGRIEINLQSVRWPSSTREDMGGHAEYLLRVFSMSPTSVAPMKLANTIRDDLGETQKTALAQWIRSNVAAIDAGTARVPDEYLATKVRSVSPRGLARGANRPYLMAFPRPEQTFANVSFSGLASIKSPGGLVRMLDTMSCQGCHQTRGLAGFHVLGLEPADAPRLNVIEVGTSPHVHEAMRYRRSVLDDVAAARAPATPRPFPDRDPTVTGKYGAHCGLGDPSFAAWTCASGYTCKDLSGEEVGMCVPEELGAGDACETSSVELTADPHADRVTDIEFQACTLPTGNAGRCSKSKGGFPNGSCSGSCARMGATNDTAICGATPPAGFNECIGRGEHFARCLENAPPAFRRKCDAQTPCGDDYVCAGVPGAPRGVGACMPPYFIFEARVDGHPRI